MAAPPITPRTFTDTALGTSWVTFATVRTIDGDATWIKPDLLTVVNTSAAAVTFQGRVDPTSGDTVEFARVLIPAGGTVEIPVPSCATVGDAIQGQASAGSALDVAFSYFEVAL